MGNNRTCDSRGFWRCYVQHEPFILSMTVKIRFCGNYNNIDFHCELSNPYDSRRFLLWLCVKCTVIIVILTSFISNRIIFTIRGDFWDDYVKGVSWNRRIITTRVDFWDSYVQSLALILAMMVKIPFYGNYNN